MSEEQREWKQLLVKSREDYKKKVDTILQDLARSLLDSPAKTSETSKRHNVEIQTDKEEPTDPPPKITANGPAESCTMSVAVRPPDSTIEDRMPEDAEMLRAELATASAEIVANESSIRSLQQSTIGLRRSLDAYFAERETFMLDLRQAQAEGLTNRSILNRISLDLERATMEIDRLRDSIRTFHHPSSRIYQSVKDAVLREMRGEPPITPVFLKRDMEVDDDIREGDERPHKRQKAAPSGPMELHHSSSVHATPPHGRSTLPDPSRLSIDNSSLFQTRSMQAVGGYPSNTQGQPPTERSTFHHTPQSASSFQQRTSQPVYYPQNSPHRQAEPRLPPQGQPVFVKQIDPSQRPDRSMPQNYVHPFSFSTTLPARGQNGQGHSHNRSRSASNSLPIMPPPSTNPHPNQPNTNSNRPQDIARPPHHMSNYTSQQQPISPMLITPIVWSHNQGQQGRNRNGSLSEPNQQQVPAGGPMNGGPVNRVRNVQPPVHSTTALQLGQHPPNPSAVASQTMAQASPTDNGPPLEPPRHISIDSRDPFAQQLLQALYVGDIGGKMMTCKTCHLQTPFPPSTNLGDAFAHSLTHRESFDVAYNGVLLRTQPHKAQTL